LEFEPDQPDADGGGLLTSVVNTAANFDVRRSLVRHWDLLLGAMVAKSAALSPLLGDASVKDQTATLKVERQLSTLFVAQVGYAADRQRVNGNLPFLLNMNRNYISLGVFCRLDQIPLGRH
jgi:hypothetical protein